MKRLFYLLFIVVMIFGISSCEVTPTGSDEDIARGELIKTCNVMFKALNRIPKVNSDFVDYNNAVNHYAQTGRFDQFIDFKASAPKNYFDAYKKSRTELENLKFNLSASTLFLENYIDLGLFLLEGPSLYITFYNNNTTLIDKELWENRRVGFNALADELNSICRSG